MDKRKPQNVSVFKSTVNVTAILVLVKIIGVIKQSVIAAYFGTSLEMDSYLLVFDFITEVSIVIFSSLSVSFLNYYILFSKNNTKEKKDEFISDIFIVFIPIAIVIVLIVIILAKPISYIIAPGFSEQDRITVISYLKVLSISILSSCLNNIFIAILEAEKDFAPGKFSGALQSVCIITGCTLFSSVLGINSLIYSYLIYCLLQNIFLLFKTFKYVHYSLVKYSHNVVITNILKESCPLFISNAVTQINAVIDKAISSGLGNGNVSALSYAYFIFSSVHSIIIGGSCGVVFSHFSSYVAEKKWNDLKKLLNDSVNIMVIVLLPIVLFLCLYSDSIIQLLYGRGKFDQDSAFLTSRALKAYSVGLLFIGIKDLVMRLYYAFQNTKIPMKNGMISVVVNISLSIILSRKWGGLGIALASSISQICGMVLILISSRIYIRDFSKIFEKESWLAIIIAGFFAVVCSKSISLFLEKNNLIIQLFINGISLLGVYFMTLLYLKCEYILQGIGKIRRIACKKKG